MGSVSRRGLATLSPAIFSLRDRIGEPIPKIGLQSGYVFVRGTVRTEVGGDAYRMATHLFHTGLHAGLQIWERHCHSSDAYRETASIDWDIWAAIA